MTENSPKNKFENMSPKQKAIAGMVALVVVFIIWQVIGMFGGGSEPVPTKNSLPTAMNGGREVGMVKQAELPQIQKPSAEMQAQLAKLQMEAQQNYVVGLNQLQLLKLTQDIADVNKNIASAKLDTVKAEKEIVELLTKPEKTVESPRNYSQDLTMPYANKMASAQIQSVAPPPAETTTAKPAAPTTVTAAQQEDTTIADYVVVSVSQLMNKWSAVLGYQGRLYNVYIGDIMPVDGAMVRSIDRFGVMLEKGTTQKKISLVPII